MRHTLGALRGYGRATRSRAFAETTRIAISATKSRRQFGFGRVHVDYDTQKRTPKRSAQLIARFIAQRGALMAHAAEAPLKATVIHWRTLSGESTAIKQFTQA